MLCYVDDDVNAWEPWNRQGSGDGGDPWQKHAAVVIVL